MRVGLLVVSLSLLLAKSQDAQAKDEEALEVSQENRTQDLDQSLWKNGPSDVERYVINNSPNNYPLEDPEETNITSKNDEVKANLTDNNSFAPSTTEDLWLEGNAENRTTISDSEILEPNLNDGSLDLNQTIVNDFILPEENVTFTENSVSTKNFLPDEEETTTPENTLEIIEVTQYLPENDNDDENDTNNDNDKMPVGESFSDIASKISDEIKVYSNEAMMSWEDVKEKVEKASEAYQVLEDYLDKIRISQSANNTECVKNDLENYGRRKRELKEVVRDCENTITREAWNKLQKKTKKVLSQISDIRERVVQAENKLSALDKNTIEKRTTILIEARHLLNNINTAKVKNELSSIEKKCLKEDEENLKTCIQGRTEKGIIVDTLNDIMRIKNNCVG